MKLFLFLTGLLGLVSAENVLFLFPIASKSHANVFEPLIKALASRGHQVTVVTPVKSKSPPPNVTEISPIPLGDFLGNFGDPFEMRRMGKLQALGQFGMEKIHKLCHQAYRDPEFQAVISQHFDLVIMNGFVNSCFDGVLVKIGAPHILLTTVAAPSFHTELTGNHLPPSFVPIPFFDFSDRMTFSERLLNGAANLFFKLLFQLYLEPLMSAVYREHLGADMPSYQQIHRNVSLIFMNSHFALTYPRPNFPDNVEVGGMHCRPAQPLPKDLDEYLSGAEHGFIYFSLGSIVQANQMPDAYRRVFLSVFGRLKQRVIWKWETEEMEDLPPNVKLSKWLPQQDVLGHPNIRVFMTHGGLLSTQEAVYHGVPLLGLPLFGDQDLNMHQAEAQGYALMLEVLDVTEERFEEKLMRLLNEPEFNTRAKELSSIFRDQMETPVERAVYWSEYVMRHKGAPALRSAARDLNYFQVHSYDVVGFLLLILTATLLLIKVICTRLIRCFFKSKSKPERAGEPKSSKKKRN